jgi:hypothetical protein
MQTMPLQHAKITPSRVVTILDIASDLVEINATSFDIGLYL